MVGVYHYIYNSPGGAVEDVKAFIYFPNNQPTEVGAVQFMFLTTEWAFDDLSHFSIIHQLVNEQFTIQTQVCLNPEPRPLAPPHTSGRIAVVLKGLCYFICLCSCSLASLPGLEVVTSLMDQLSHRVLFFGVISLCRSQGPLQRDCVFRLCLRLGRKPGCLPLLRGHWRLPACLVTDLLNPSCGRIG